MPPLLLLFTLPLLFYGVDGSCDSITASVSQKISKAGLHRELQYRVELKDDEDHDLWSHGACRLSVRQVLPSGAYVSPDELKELRRHRKVHASPAGNVDVEKPKHLSRPLIVWLYANVEGPYTTFNLPIHLRYHRAKAKGGYETVKIKQPWVLLRCPTRMIKMCTESKMYGAPCVEFSQRECSWHNITTIPATSPLNLAVPVGNLDDFAIVAPVTMIACFGGCLLILAMLGKTDFTQRRLEKKNK